MSIKPGVTASPSASMTFAASPPNDRPTAAIRPSCTARSPGLPGRPLPSKSVPPRIRMSQLISRPDAPRGGGRVLIGIAHRLRPATPEHDLHVDRFEAVVLETVDDARRTGDAFPPS